MEKVFKELKAIIANGQIEMAIEKTLRIEPSQKQIVILSSNFSQLKRKYIKNILPYDAYQIELNRITNSLLDYLDKLESDVLDGKAPGSGSGQTTTQKAPRIIDYQTVENEIHKLGKESEQHTPQKILSTTSLVLEFGTLNFNNKNLDDCIVMYQLFIQKFKEHILPKINRIGFDDVCSKHITKAFDTFKLEASDKEDKRKLAHILRKQIDCITDTENYRLAIEKFDDLLIEHRDTFNAVHGEIVMEIIELVRDEIGKFNTAQNRYLAYQLAMEYLYALGNYFKKQKKWLNPTQKRFSQHISEDIIKLLNKGHHQDLDGYSDFIMEFNELMIDIRGQMEMNLEFYCDEFDETIDIKYD